MKKIFALLVAMLAFVSCSQFEEQEPNRLNEAEQHGIVLTRSVPSDGLFETMENPYTLERMRRLTGNPTLQPSHIYGRFLPTDSAQLNLLADRLELDLFDYPLDINIEDDEEYVDPTIPEGEFTWQYTVVPTDFDFPEGIMWEKLTDAYIPADDEEIPGTASTRAPEYERILEKMAILDAGYVIPAETRADSGKPKGRVTVYDNVKGKDVPVKGVRVKCHYFLKIANDYTDADGYYSITKKFYVKPNYVVVFKNIKDFILWDFLGARAKYRVKYRQDPDGYNIVIKEDTWHDTWERAVINNAAYEYYCICEETGIRKPPSGLRIWVRPNGEMSSAPMLRRISGVQYMTRSGWLSMSGPILIPLDTIFKFLEPDVFLGTNGDDYRDIYETVHHELSHASHFSQVGSSYWAKYVSYIADNGSYGSGLGSYGGICEVGEMWGYAMGHIYECEEYNIDLLNNPYASIWLRPETWLHPDPIWALITRGVLTKKQVFDCLTSDVDTKAKLIDKMCGKYPDKAPLVEMAFARDDVMSIPVVTGPDKPALNANATYNFTASLPSGVVFAGWTVTPASYTAPYGQTNRALDIRFTSATRYTLTANFRLPDDTPSDPADNPAYSVSKVVDLSPVVPVTPIISADKTQVAQGEPIIFTVNNYQSELTYKWYKYERLATQSTSHTVTLTGSKPIVRPFPDPKPKEPRPLSIELDPNAGREPSTKMGVYCEAVDSNGTVSARSDYVFVVVEGAN